MSEPQSHAENPLEPTPLPWPTHENEVTRCEQIEELKFFLSTAPMHWDPVQIIRQLRLPTGECISCVLWRGLFHITGTDIVRSLVFRFHAFGRPVKNMKKFEEGIFSDLRNLKPGVHACLEEPKSEFLELLHKNNCIRTQKKQKVFFWCAVPHDRLFFDALERDLRRERMDTEPTSIAIAEPALSLSFEAPQEAFEEFRKTLTLTVGLESEPSSPLGSLDDGQSPASNPMDVFDMAPFQYVVSNDNMEMGLGQMKFKNQFPVNELLAMDEDAGMDWASTTTLTASKFSRSLRGYSLYQLPSAMGLTNADLFGSPLLENDLQFRSQQTATPRPPRRNYTSHPSLQPSAAYARQNQPFAVSNPTPILLGSVCINPDEHTSNTAPIQTPSVFPTPGQTRSTPTVSPRSKVSTEHSRSSSFSTCQPTQEYAHMSATPSTSASPVMYGMSDLTPPYSPNRRRSSSFSSLSIPTMPLTADRSHHQDHNRSISHPSLSHVVTASPAPSPSRSTPCFATGNGEIFGLDRTYICPVPNCDRTFKRLEHVKRHFRTHTSERPYGCHVCGKRFSRTDNLSQHKKTHEKKWEREVDRERKEGEVVAAPWIAQAGFANGMAMEMGIAGIASKSSMEYMTTDGGQIHESLAGLDHAFMAHDASMSALDESEDSLFLSYNNEGLDNHADLTSQFLSSFCTFDQIAYQDTIQILDTQPLQPLQDQFQPYQCGSVSPVSVRHPLELDQETSATAVVDGTSDQQHEMKTEIDPGILEFSELSVQPFTLTAPYFPPPMFSDEPEELSGENDFDMLYAISGVHGEEENVKNEALQVQML
ncbi:STE like transcription factor-domain-containing protein [Jimgerdemannia flammicorona]|uniref:STE like transcription factor-domain-containing protein n=1 Tax=Jimgerdemannia flammicorona TaxID=994334 RepID=A0A433Q280_9FUNG|nr:STE like transcription factor-domain-containing protein [Jimgerdemannia flammicorona]